MVDQLKSRTVEKPLPWSRRVCLAVSKQLPEGWLPALIGHESLKLCEEDLKEAMKIVHELGLGGNTPALALAQSEVGNVGGKKRKCGLFGNDGPKNTMPSNDNQVVMSAVDLKLASEGERACASSWG
jgi:hypothetical protein